MKTLKSLALYSMVYKRRILILTEELLIVGS